MSRSSLTEESCSLCNGVGMMPYASDTLTRKPLMGQCECIKNRALQVSLNRIPEQFRNFFFGKHVATIQQASILQTINKHPTRGLFLSGQTAGGKTALLWSQYKQLIEIRHKVLFYKAIDLIGELMEAELRDAYSDAITRVKGLIPVHVFIDDITAIGSTEKINEYRWPVLLRFFDDVIDRRERVTLSMTSMLDFNGLRDQNRLPVAVIRRISDLCEQHQLPNWKKV